MNVLSTKKSRGGSDIGKREWLENYQEPVAGLCCSSVQLSAEDQQVIAITVEGGTSAKAGVKPPHAQCRYVIINGRR